jgi:hypothetical protein
MEFNADFELISHRAKYAFYYERATALEVGAMEALCFLNICVTLAVHGRRNQLPPEVLAALEKTTNVLESQLMEVVGIIRAGPTLALLTESQWAAMEAGCLTIQFLE